MALDRDGTLKKAEKLVRQGRLDLAIAEYLRVVEDNPRDWSTGQHARRSLRQGRAAGAGRRAVHPHRRAFRRPGLLPEGRRPLPARSSRSSPTTKIPRSSSPTSRRVRACSPTPRSHLNSIAAKRRARGDRRGTAEIVVRLGTIDPADFDARLAAAARRWRRWARRRRPAAASRRCTTICSKRIGPPKRSTR